MSTGAGEKPRREEVEVKLPCDDLDEVRHRLRDLGAPLKSVLHFESNDLFDDAEGRLRSSGRALRLRREGEAGGDGILTYKGVARFSEGIKTREEREVHVSNPEEAEAILLALGFVRAFRYEKRREEWTLEECSIALDETPIGTFVEIEGSPIAIRRCVSALELDFSRAIPYTYARLYADRRKADPSLPPDMVFTRPG
ncbi:MAG TPA: class IV adenylate cyclase [Thermoanaerobaculia bacterium]|nr:class IV adenylate cyclase [Thermoanaerobaculia bacterium]